MLVQVCTALVRCIQSIIPQTWENVMSPGCCAYPKCSLSRNLKIFMERRSSGHASHMYIMKTIPFQFDSERLDCKVVNPNYASVILFENSKRLVLQYIQFETICVKTYHLSTKREIKIFDNIFHMMWCWVNGTSMELHTISYLFLCVFFFRYLYTYVD